MNIYLVYVRDDSFSSDDPSLLIGVFSDKEIALNEAWGYDEFCIIEQTMNSTAQGRVILSEDHYKVDTPETVRDMFKGRYAAFWPHGLPENPHREWDLPLSEENRKVFEDMSYQLWNVFRHAAFARRRVPNGYCGDGCCPHRPWFVFHTRYGPIKVGWRKRVIEISWNNSAIKKTALELFPNEDVTRFDKTIHAWGYEKATEYVKVLLSQS